MASYISYPLLDAQQAQAQNKPTVVLVEAAQHIYLAAANISSSSAEPKVKVSDLTEVELEVNHTVAELKDDQGNITAYSHTYDLTVNRIPEEWDIGQLYVRAVRLDIEQSAELPVTGNMAQFSTFADSAEIEIVFQVQGKRTSDGRVYNLTWKKLP